MGKEQPAVQLEPHYVALGWRLEWYDKYGLWDVRAVKDDGQSTGWHYYTARRGLKFVLREMRRIEGEADPAVTPTLAIAMSDYDEPIELDPMYVALGWSLEWRTRFDQWRDVRAVKADGTVTDWHSAEMPLCMRGLRRAMQRLEGMEVERDALDT